MVQLSHPYMTSRKAIALTIRTFVVKMMSLLLNTLPRFVIVFLPRSKHLLISQLQSSSAMILQPKKIVCHCFHCFPIYLPWNDGTRCHDLHFLNVEFYAWRISGTEEPGGPQSMGWQSQTTEWLTLSFSTFVSIINDLEMILNMWEDVYRLCGYVQILCHLT